MYTGPPRPHKRTFATLGTLPALVLILLALPPLVFGVIRALQVQRGIAGLEVAEGTIVRNGLRMSPDPEGSRTRDRYYYPVVSFTTPSGASHQFTDTTGASPAQYAVGDTVDVLFDPGGPTVIGA
jgi:hypothetical protein